MKYSLTTTERNSLILLSKFPTNIDFVSSLLLKIGESNINLDMISQVYTQGFTTNLGFTIEDTDLGKALEIIGELRANYPEIQLTISSSNCKISIFSDDMVETPGFAARILKVLAENNIELRLITTSENELSLLIGETFLEDAINCIKVALS